MPSGVRINWLDYDHLIIKHLPSMTISEFTETYVPHISKKAVGSRASKLGISASKKVLTEERKKKISKQFTKNVDQTTIDIICSEINKLSRKDISRKTGISLYLINKIIKNAGLEIDFEFQKQIHSEKSANHVHLAIKASSEMWNNEEYRNMMSTKLSVKAKKLWKDEKYRAKVKNGMNKVYQETDLKKRLSEINKERYKNDESVRKILHSERPFKTSKLNERIGQVLEFHNIEFETEYELCNYKFDFKIGNILLEAQGDYWHSLPDNIKNDRTKASIIRKYYPQFELKYIWESEFKSVRGQDRLLEIIGFTQPVSTYIDLNEMDFEAYTDKREAEKFINSHHYLGWTKRISKMFRLQYHNQTIMIATFGPPVRLNTAPGRVLELVRLCRNPYFYNKNMGSYFLSKCERFLKDSKEFDNLVSFSDDRIHYGSIYAASNWQCLGKTQSDYQYISQNNVPMHKKTLYNRAKQHGMTEKQYAKLNNYRKSSVRTKTKWVKNLKSN